MKRTAPKTRGAMTRCALLGALAEKSGLSDQQVECVIDDLTEIAASELKRVGVFKTGEYLSLKLVAKPAAQVRKGAHPFAKECVAFKEEPVSNIVRARVLKRLNKVVEHVFFQEVVENFLGSH